MARYLRLPSHNTLPPLHHAFASTGESTLAEERQRLRWEQKKMGQKLQFTQAGSQFIQTLTENGDPRPLIMKTHDRVGRWRNEFSTLRFGPRDLSYNT